MVTLARRAQRIPFAPVVAALFGVAAAILVAAVPQWMFEAAVVASGLPAVVAAAAPPLGLVARMMAIALAFAGVALLVWLLLAPLTKFFEARARARTPWRDAGYDAGLFVARDDPLPPRRPIFAPDELGAPLMSDEAIAPVIDFPKLEAALAAPIPTDALQPAVVAPVALDKSIAALIRRLEDGLARRASNDPTPDGSGPDGSGNAAMPLSSSWIMPESLAAVPLENDDGTLRQALGSLRRMARG